MLLHPAPRRVFVLGLGTGMTLGATSIHPTVEEITLAEIERGVLPAARAFGDYNHHVLDDPRLRIVHDDGRNFLRTTRESFDVITADPIHPWSGGAAYLYTVEHFRTAAARLAEGGVLCQWLPIYELDPEDLRSIVRTFSESFRHTVIWLTYYDAELVGSNAPIVLDEAAIAARMSDPAVAADLAVVDMGTARDFLSYFVMGDAGVRAFSRTGVIHTDDNLWLEFQAPRSRGKRELPGANVMALAEFRDPPPIDGAAQAAPLYDRAHALGLWNRWDDPEFRALLSTLRQDYSDYAPGRFLESRYEEVERRQPRPVGSERIAVRGADGTLTTVDLTAVTFHIGPERGIVVLVDNAARDVWIERYVDAPVDEIDSRLQTLALRLLDGVRAEKSTSGGAADRAELVRKLERVAEGRGPGG